ncbi:hypothetical protein Bca101_072425 [Brassica carinata]
MMEAGQLEELPSHGNGFTWGGKRNNCWIQSRLDRCFGNKEWFRQFPCANQSFLDKRGSDHRPVLINFIEAQESYRGSFKFDRRLLEIEGIKDNVINAWDFGGNNGVATVSSRLRACRKVLSGLKKQVNMNSRDRIQQAEVALEREQSSNQPSVEHINVLKRELVRAYRDEEIYWRQKSKEKWLRGGDRNTRFFHNSVKMARARNTIDKLINEEGVEVFSEAAKGEVAVQYFSNLFKSSNPTSFGTWFQGMRTRVTTNMNHELTKPVSDLEVKQDVFALILQKHRGLMVCLRYSFKNSGK